MDREAFVKGQLEAVHKALTKYEVPLKPKHARRLIVGTHQESQYVTKVTKTPFLGGSKVQFTDHEKRV
ncbi:hypothetical protein Y032_0007g3265 [Ancylostoma ceylanicum]|uniref:AP180 N-terminal homology (ANTH) domain-containing protein n=1 Tax=Ancylostoma ceylanicum TaxID=53326 RepID=A0A016VLP8_9BILA|nr:hypothetical protein Y032_0007g3265 [Ancylostoma ceylanicum]